MPQKDKNKEMKKKLTFKRGIRRINIPLIPEIDGEMIRTIRKVVQYYKLPKYSRIGIERIICVDKKYPYDMTQVFIEK